MGPEGGNSDMRRGCAGLRLSMSPAELSASLQRSAIASEFTYSKFRSHSGSRRKCSASPAGGSPTRWPRYSPRGIIGGASQAPAP